MKKYSSILKMSLGAALLACSLPVSAQSTIGKDVAPALLIPHNQSVGYNERTLILSVRSNLDYTITSDADWATARKGSDGAIYVPCGEKPCAGCTYGNADLSRPWMGSSNAKW